jgi:hypothetical protein
LNRLENNISDVQNNNILLNKDLQFKLSRHDNILSKIESDHSSMMTLMKDLQSQFIDTQRTLNMRMGDIEVKVNDLNSKLDAILNEQTLIIKNVEGDTVKQLQLLDTKTRSVKTSFIFIFKL